MNWPILISAFFGAAAPLLVKVVFDFLHERHRAKNQKNIQVHQVQFEKEFAVYKELWVAALEVARQAEQFRSVRFQDSTLRDMDSLNTAFKRFNDVVFQNRPFYLPEVFDCAKAILNKIGDIVGSQRGIEQSEKGKAAILESDEDEQSALEEKRDDESKKRFLRKETSLDDLNKTLIPELCDEIRKQIWRR